MDRAFLLVKVAVAVGILAVYFKWRHRSDEAVFGINRLSQWMVGNKDTVLRYARFAQAAAGLFLVLLGYYTGQEHFHLIRQGVRAEGTIVGYKQESFPDGSGTHWDTGSMPIVNFQTGERDVQFKDWLGSKAPLLNVRVVVLYDPANPSVAMIDRPVWNWMPWAPIFAVGLFLVLVAIKGFLLS